MPVALAASARSAGKVSVPAPNGLRTAANSPPPTSALVIMAATAALAEPDRNEIIRYDPFGYPETRTQRDERMERQAGGYQTFDRAGRPL